MSAAVVHASRVLRRRAAGEDLGAHHGDGDDDADGAFWAGGAPRLYDFSQQQQLLLEQKSSSPAPPSPAPVASPPSAAADSVAPCLLTLQCSCVGWGVRKRVRYVVRHLARHALSLPAGDGERAVAAQEDEESSTKAKKKEKKNENPGPEKQEAAEEESSEDDRKVAITTEKKRRRKRGRGRGHGGAKRPRKEEEKTLPAPKAGQLEEKEEVVAEEEKAAAPSGMVDRWKATRYATAEASLLAIMRARAGKPIPRGELRKEARARIGDTGLLDHLLRHIADNLAPGRAERFRRRHNANGALEYWLEPAELVAVRRVAGVADPYWVPPPGWKPGDPASPEGYALEVKKQVEQLAAELAGVKRHMDHLTSNVMQVSKEMKSEVEKSYNSWQEKYACMEKANGNLEKQLLSLEEKYENARQANGELKEELLFLKEKYVIVVENNTRLEQQLAALSTSFLSLKEELLWLEKEADLYVKEPWEDDNDKQEDDAGKVTDDDAAGVGAANQPAVDGDGTTTTTSSSNGTTDGRGRSCVGKRTSRKCSVRISKPQGAFQWPPPSLPFSPELAAPPSPLLTPTVAGASSLANFATMDELYEYMMAGGLPTPPSASSTNAGKLPLLPAAPACTSPVKTAGLDAGNVGTELALATPAY